MFIKLLSWMYENGIGKFQELLIILAIEKYEIKEYFIPLKNICIRQFHFYNFKVE